eukprot:GHRR01007101.1.p1 GENE.GHRR01007101.1~~GHRR01007101.1.p1  ORF type:complete len:167 (+),score=8.91 GHRR01007101.1:19-519(+)
MDATGLASKSRCAALAVIVLPTFAKPALLPQVVTLPSHCACCQSGHRFKPSAAFRGYSIVPSIRSQSSFPLGSPVAATHSEVTAYPDSAGQHRSCRPIHMPAACHGLITAYVDCLRQTACYKERKKTVTDCSAELPEECSALRYALFACKRGQVDARSRIQGNKGY